MKRLSRTIAAFAAVAALSGCGGATVTPSGTGRTQTATHVPGLTVTAVSSRYGTVLADRRGQAFYLFGREDGPISRCYGACAKSWPPVLTTGPAVAGSGARGDLLGTARRRDGTLQVTYRGRPVYYYVDDRPGRILCQDVTEFGGRWLVVRPDGTPVT